MRVYEVEGLPLDLAVLKGLAEDLPKPMSAIVHLGGLLVVEVEVCRL